MKKSLIKLFLLLLVTKVTLAVNPLRGDYREIYDQAEENFINQNYTAALALYIRLDSMESGNANINFKIGFCYLNAPTYKVKSIPYLEFAIKNITYRYGEGDINEKQAPFVSYYYLAKAYHLNYEFDKAIAMYEKYKTELGTGKKVADEIAEVDHDIETCNFGKELIKTPKAVIIENLGENINSKYPDYSPVISLDEKTIMFTSRRAGGTSDTTDVDGRYFEDIYTSTYSDDNEMWKEAVSIGPNINTVDHEAVVNLSADGHKLLIYKDDGGNGNIYVSTLNGEEWGIPEYIERPINSSSWESHACYTSDNRILYFVSDRPGGYGGRDIYKCLKLPNGDWGPAENLGNVINTKYDEDAVFIHPDGKQIFFSSKGHNSMGGFDIFTSIINGENGYWSIPENYGYPINTPDDDIFLVTSADGRHAYFSSDKEGGFGDKDIYIIKYPEHGPANITLLLGNIINNTKQSIKNNSICIIDVAKNDTIQQLTANNVTGKFGANLPVGASYKLIYKVNDKEFFSETLDVPKGKGYQVVKREIPYNNKKGASSSDKNDILATATECDPQKATYQLFFKYNKKEIDVETAEFKAFVYALINCINANPKLQITIESSASTVPTKTFKNNKNLALVRSEDANEKVKKTLLKNGVDKSKIVFSKPSLLVQGPEYKDDLIRNMAIYEKYQYIKVYTTVKNK
jgi:hypothetical protein